MLSRRCRYGIEATVPEGDTLHRIAKALVVLEGQVVHAVTLPRQPGRGASLTGSVVDEVQAVAKNLLITFDTGLVLHTHLMMTGVWHLYAQGERWRRSPEIAVAVVAAGPWVAVCFGAPVVRLVERRRIERELLVAGATTDLLAEDAVFDLDEVVRRLRDRNAVPLGEAVMDQRAVGGIGNVYKSEVAFVCGHDPRMPAAALSQAQYEEIFTVARDLLLRNLGTGPRITRDREAGDRPGDDRYFVYGRGGKPCRTCKTNIECYSLGEPPRWTWSCPRCQVRPPEPTGTASGAGS